MLFGKKIVRRPMSVMSSCCDVVPALFITSTFRTLPRS